MFGGRSSSRSATRSSAAPAKPAAAAPAAGGVAGGLGSTMASGMAFGVGSAVAHQAVGRMMGGSSEGSHTGDAPSETNGNSANAYENEGATGSAAQTNPCMSFNQSLLQCLQSNNSNIGLCQVDMNAITQCERDNANII